MAVKQDGAFARPELLQRRGQNPGAGEQLAVAKPPSAAFVGGHLPAEAAKGWVRIFVWKSKKRIADNDYLVYKREKEYASKDGGNCTSYLKIQ